MTTRDSSSPEALEVKVTADTQEFSKSVADIGNLLEKSLLGAVRKGSIGFDDLKRVAFKVLDDIAAQALGTLFNTGGSKDGGGLLGGLGGIVGSILGLPGRATGGNVSPGRGYLVGERGPEVCQQLLAGIDIDPKDGHVWAYERCGAGTAGGGPVDCDNNPVDPVFKFDRHTGRHRERLMHGAAMCHLE